MIAQPARALCRQPALVFLPGGRDFDGGNRPSTRRRGGTASAPIPFLRSGVGRAGSPAVLNILHAATLAGISAIKRGKPSQFRGRSASGATLFGRFRDGPQ